MYFMFHVDRVWTSTRGEGGPAYVDREEGSQKRDFFVDVINGWPLIVVLGSRRNMVRLQITG